MSSNNIINDNVLFNKDNQKKYKILNSNVLKLIALITMTIDHIGAILFPQYDILRIIGRIAFPIFAYMIAEGCYYTKHKVRYLGEVAIIALICQLVYFFADNSIRMCILVTFCMSISIIFAIQFAKKNGTLQALILPVGFTIAAYEICQVMPVHIRGFSVDYGFIGVMIPVFVFLASSDTGKLLAMTGGLLILGFISQGPQMWALLALIPLALYNGKKGRLKLKQFFYIYYPVHLGILGIIAG